MDTPSEKKHSNEISLCNVNCACSVNNGWTGHGLGVDCRTRLASDVKQDWRRDAALTSLIDNISNKNVKTCVEEKLHELDDKNDKIHVCSSHSPAWLNRWLQRVGVLWMLQ